MDNKIAAVLWDTTVIIDAIQKSKTRYHLIEPFIDQAESGNLKIVVSEMAVAEARYLKELNEKNVSLKKQADMILEWLDNDYILRRPVHPGISELASNIGRLHNVKPPDAIIASTAIFYKVPYIHTFDGMEVNGSITPRSMLSLDGKIGDPLIRICFPNPDEGLLWEGIIQTEDDEVNLQIIKELNDDNDDVQSK